MNLESLARYATQDIESKNLRSPNRRLSGLRAVLGLIRQSYPKAIDDVQVLQGLPRATLRSALEKSKGRILNGAEVSALHILLSYIPGDTP